MARSDSLFQQSVTAMPRRACVEAVQVFDHHWHTSEWSREGATGTLERRLRHVVDDCVEFPVHRFNTGKSRFAEFRCRCSSVVHQLGLRGGVKA